MKFKIVFLFILVAFLSCSRKKSEYIYISGFAQGTTYNITYENSANKDYSNAIDSILKAFDRSLSSYDSTSIISRINNNEANVAVDSWFTEVFLRSEEIFEITDGAFDITVGPVARAWGFGDGPVAKHDSAHIVGLLQYVGMQKVKLQDGKVIKQSEGVKIDVNAIAQGYSVDVVCKFFDDAGIKNYLVEIGGEVRGIGTNAKNKYWRIGIDKPFDENMTPGAEIQAIVELNNKSLATSGNYRKFFVEDGIKYSHTIDPKTGFPARNTLLSATVVSDDCMTADGFATAFMVLGIEKSIELQKKLEGIDVYFVYSNKDGGLEVFVSEGMKKIITE